jgi:hypothetical protein
MKHLFNHLRLKRTVQ